MLQNLLSKYHKKRLKEEYYLRFSTVASLLLAVAVGIGVVALIPAYASVASDLRASKAEYDLRKEMERDNEQSVAEVQKTKRILELLEAEYEKEKVTATIDDVFALRPEGITIVGFTYTRSANNATLEGVAATRDLVAPFARSLESGTRYTNVPVPISDLAQNTDVVFRLDMSVAEEE